MVINGIALFSGFSLFCDTLLYCVLIRHFTTTLHMNSNLSDLALRLKAIIDTAIDGIITIDDKGIVETINPAAADLFGYDPQEVIGQNVKMLMPSPYHEEHDGYLTRYIKTNEPHIIGIGREVEGKKKDGTTFPLRLAVSEVMGQNKRIFTGIIHDLSDVKEAQEKVVQLNKKLELKNNELEEKVEERTSKLERAVNKMLEVNSKLKKEISEREHIENALRQSEEELRTMLNKEKELSELKNRFVSMASHEFRTPLSTILSSIELVEAYTKEDQQGKRVKHVNRVRNAVNHLTSVLNDFLSLSRLEEGRIELKNECFVLRDFCLELLDIFQGEIEPQQSLHHQGINDDQEICCDKNALQHILFNLISNASKYSKADQPIYCDTEVKDNQLFLSIRDEGIGIPEEDQKYLFTRFFRANNVENIKGTGLGLNIIKRYVDLLNGDISFTSKQGKGTTFKVRIPLQ